MKLSLVIPCYNEGKNIPMIFKRLSEVITRDDIEVVFVNNGSTDDSAQYFDDLIAKHSFARLCTVKENEGYGHGILQGLKQAKGEYIGWTHADMQTDPYDALRALDMIEQQGSPTNIYVKGRRQGRPLMDRFFTAGMGVFESVYLSTPLWDINAQPNIFHRSFFDSWASPPKDFSLDLFALYTASTQQLLLHRFPVFFGERQHGTSSWNTGMSARWKFIQRTIEYSRKLKKELRK